jgi:hypothetical protein
MRWTPWTLAALLVTGCGRVTGSVDGDEPDSAVLGDGGSDATSTSDGGFDCAACAFGCNTTMNGCARLGRLTDSEAAPTGSPTPEPRPAPSDLG